MDNRYGFLFALPLLLIAAIFALLYPNSGQKITVSAHSTVNAVIGDASYVATFGKLPTSNTPERIRIKTHLKYVERLLRNRPTKHLSKQQKRNRRHNLKLLRNYIETGQFPYNDGHPDTRRPTFIDNEGNICAVGYLVEQTAARQMAKAINRDYKYAYITGIDDPSFKKWAKRSGFTITELATIQPAYGGQDNNHVIKRNRNRVETAYGLGSALLTAANTLYLSNRVKDPWLFPSSAATHWTGLASGTGSVVLGVLNLDNSKTYSIPTCGTFPPCWQNTYKQSNHLRTGLSIANIGIGVITVIRSAYHLLNPKNEQPEQLSKTELGVTNLQTSSTPIGQSVPALQFRYHF